MSGFHDVFISYGRADSKEFTATLCDRLTALGLEVWYDQHDIPLGVDFQNQINAGIEKAHNFLFVIAPHSVNSPYCAKEIELAVRHRKRIIPLLHVEQISYETWQRRNPNNTPEQWDDYVASGLHSSFDNMHPMISKINWVYFREGQDDFEQALAGLLSAMQRQQAYVHQHTHLLIKALEWERHQKQSQYLLIGEERQVAQQWLMAQFANEQSPCEPTDLHCEYICESIQNANNLMTQVFVSHAEVDRALTDRVVKTLMRQGITVWTSRADIKTGAEFQEEIRRGIEEANNMVFLISQSSLDSAYCTIEIDYALQYHKRIVPLLIEPIDPDVIPERLRSLQFIDLTQPETPEVFQEATARLLKTLHEDAAYYEQHKLLLSRSLKWERQNRNASILLRGYNLSRAEAWLKVAKGRSQHPPTALQLDYIAESQKQPPNESLEVFISYSRADSDFARRLNDELQLQGKTTWFDQESIAAGEDFQREIYQGIETSDNFLFVLSPSSVQSPYCADEVEYAAKNGKRIVTVLHRPIQTETLHPALATVQWIDFNQHKGDFYASFGELVRTLEIDRDHVRQHTKWSLRAKNWDEHKRSADLLLRGSEFALALNWLEESALQQKQPPATDLQKALVAESSRAIATEIKQEKRRVMILGTLLGLMSVAFVFALAQYRNAAVQRDRAEAAQESQIRALSRYGFVLRDNQQQMKALVESIRAAKQLQQQMKHVPVAPETQAQVITSLQNALHDISEIHSWEGHPQPIHNLAISPDGSSFATAGKDGMVRLWDMQGRAIATLKGHKGGLWDVAYSPDGQTLASVGNDKTVRLWNLKGELLQTLEGHENWVYTVAFSPDGSRIASSGLDRTTRIWDRQGNLLHTLRGHSLSVFDLAFSPDGQQLATASADGSVKLWSLDGVEQRTFKANDESLTSIDFSPDGQQIATAGEDKAIHLWSRDGELLKTIDNAHNETVRQVKFSPDGRLLVSAGLDDVARLWTVAGEELQTIRGHQDNLYGVGFHPTASILITVSTDQRIKLWQYNVPQFDVLQGHTGAVYTTSFSPDAETIATASADGTAKLWSRRNGELLQTLTGGAGETGSVSFSPDGKWLATAGDDSIVRLWTSAGTLVKTLEGHSSTLVTVAFSPDSTRLASGGYDQGVRVWSVEGEPLFTLDEHESVITGLQFSPDGALLASASNDGTVRLWNADGKLARTLTHEAPVTTLRFSPDGQILATATDEDRLRLWSLDSKASGLSGSGEAKPSEVKQEAKQFVTDSTVKSMDFGFGGKLLVTGGDENLVQIWTLEGKPITNLEGHHGTIYGVQFSPDGQTLATASDDQTVRLWRLAGDRLLPMADLWSLDLEALLKQSCDWAADYLAHSNEVDEGDRTLCQ
jgi:WD40 repeat protein